MKKNRFFGFCAILVGLGFCIAGVQRLVEPDYYQAAIEIELQPDFVDSGPGDYSPNFLETELTMMRSDIVLSNVVETLNLNAAWGKRYANGKEFSTSETIKLLRRRVYIENYPNTRLAEIQVRDENPDGAASIANSIAEVYGNYREMDAGIRMLKRRYREEATDIVQIEANLKALEKELIGTNSQLSDEISLMKVALNDRKNVHNLLAEKIEAGKLNAADPSTAVIAIVTPAESPTSPAGPNRWLGAACLVCGLLFGSWGSFKMLAGERKPK